MSRLLLQPAAPTSRVGRYPKHAFRLKERAFSAQPFMIAPVLPGETLKNIYFEARVVTDPVVNSIIGWKKEYVFFYVKITDLLNDAIRDMFIDPANTDLTATLGIGANDKGYYTAKGSVDYLKRSVQSIMTHWFRDEGEAWNNFVTADGIPMVQIRDQYWMDSLTDEADLPEGEDISEATDMGDLDRLMDAFEQLRALGIANMTYEDWLRSNGIRIPEKDENKPERIAWFSDFQYPSNTIDPADGSPSSAVSWVFKNSQRDPKFFKEPGFIIGLSITRPKVYFSGLAGNLAGFMGRAWDWMPNYLAGMPETSLKMFGADGGPLGDRYSSDVTPNYWVDMRDLLLYGDQFHNEFSMNNAGALGTLDHFVGLPYADLNSKYMTEAMAKTFFVNNAATDIRSDGVVSLSVQGSQRDHTVGNFATL